MEYDSVAVLFHRLDRELCGAAAQAAKKMIIDECGGLRVYFPSNESIWREERNSKIRKLFTGSNYEELKLRFGMSKKQLKRILRGTRPVSA